MTALEYMERQLKKHSMNLERERKRGAPEEVLDDIALKISYYEEAVEDMRGMFDATHVVRCKDCVYGEEAKENERGFLICPASGMEITGNDFCSYGESKEEAV